MVFSSQLFLFYFLPLTLLLYYALPSGRNLVLTLASYVFYGWTNPWFVWLMLLSTLVDYLCGRAMTNQRPFGDRNEPLGPLPAGPRTRRQRLALTVSILTNLVILGVFKYLNFGIDTCNALLSSAGLESWQYADFVRLTLPLGISFYTFQSMSYSIDVYRGEAAPVKGFLDFACFVAMFPQLVAGPIVRFREISEQLHHREHRLDLAARGVALFSLGLAKKVLLADPCGHIADLAFDAGPLAIRDAWFGATSYALQIYFDFSGYSDMAIGLGLLFGFRFPINFQSPYKSSSISEFWRRWHMSLSQWLRDYVYIPLGGNRLGTSRTYVNLLLVMLLGGLWHGAAWNFVVWGGLHGVLLAVERWVGITAGTRRLPLWLARPLTFGLIIVSWVLFRAEDLGSAVGYLETMLGLVDPSDGSALIAGWFYQPYNLLVLATALIVTFALPTSVEWTRSLPAWRASVCLALLALSLVFVITRSFSPFIYFIF